MRSVVVVLPASMCAAIPILRVRGLSGAETLGVLRSHMPRGRCLPTRTGMFVSSGFAHGATRMLLPSVPIRHKRHEKVLSTRPQQRNGSRSTRQLHAPVRRDAQSRRVQSRWAVYTSRFALPAAAEASGTCGASIPPECGAHAILISWILPRGGRWLRD